MLALLWPGMPAPLQMPVLAYVLCLGTMAAQAANKFAGPLPPARLWILSTYWAAQWCIASWLAPATLRKAGSPPAR